MFPTEKEPPHQRANCGRPFVSLVKSASAPDRENFKNKFYKFLILGSCSGSLYCNCDYRTSSWQTDEGFLTYKSTLPVTELQFGNLGSSNEYGWFTLGPLICTGIDD